VRDSVAESLVTCVGVCKSFSGQRVLMDVDFDLRPGEVHVLAGENGAGKSTLVRILAGAIQHDAGQVRIGSRETRWRSVHEASTGGVAMIHQELSLAPSMSVMDNLFLGRERTTVLGWLQRGTQRQEAIDALRRVGLDVDPATTVATLPLAAQQMVEIAKALMHDARILIMDEPTSALPRPDVERLFALIDQLKSNAAHPAGIIYISHRMEEIYRLADRITVLRDGRRIVTSDARDLPRGDLIHAMVGREVEEPTRPPAMARGAELLRIERITVHGSNGAMVRDASLRLHRGEIMGLAGLQGSGSGALLHALFGDGRIISGAVFINGAPVRIVSPRGAMEHGIALLTDDRKTTGLCRDLSIGGNLALPSTREYSPGGWRRVSREGAAARRAIDAFRIRCRSAAQPVRTLSGGNQQKVALGKWLVREPSILLLHDPTRGVDVGARQEIYRLIHDATARGAGVIMTSTDLPELLALCDRIIVLHRGAVTAEFDRAQATPRSVIAAAMGESGGTAGAAA